MLTPLKRLSSMVVETLHSRPGGGSDFGIVALDWTPEWEDPRARDLAVLRGMSAELWRVDMEAGGGRSLSGCMASPLTYRRGAPSNR